MPCGTSGLMGGGDHKFAFIGLMLSCLSSDLHKAIAENLIKSQIVQNLVLVA